MQNRKPVICDRCRREGIEGLGHFRQTRALLDFKPVPRRNQRHDGWTEKRQKAFIAALAETASVSLAAQAVNMSAEGAYVLRRQPGAEEFREAWEAALDHGAEIIDAKAIERATEGVAVPIFHNGEQVGERRVYNERLTMWMLQHRKPAKYGAAKRGSLGAEQIDHAEAVRADALAHHEEWLERIGKMYRGRIRQEREARLAGNVTAADFYLRQLTHMEVILELNGGGKHLLWFVETGQLADDWTPDWKAAGARLYRRGEPVWQTDTSTRLDAARRLIWEELGDPQRPPLPWHWGEHPHHIAGGPDRKDRECKLAEAQAKAAEAQRLWEEAAREEWEARTGETWRDLPEVKEADDPA